MFGLGGGLSADVFLLVDFQYFANNVQKNINTSEYVVLYVNTSDSAAGVM